MTQGYFVTGTDTGVGKTLVSRILLHRLRQMHAHVAGFKPVASGCTSSPAGLRNADALALQAASSVATDYAVVNPYAFEEPVAPHLAATAAGVDIDLEHIRACIESVAADRVVVEGVGGWLVPLGTGTTVADLAQILGLPIVLVVGLRLGCLNHALLTAESMRARGVPVAGWVANQVDPAMSLVEANIAALQERLDLPLLMILPWMSGEQRPEQWVTTCTFPA